MIKFLLVSWMFIAQKLQWHATYNYKMGYSNTAIVIMRNDRCRYTHDEERSN